jgi:hypothetical protein
MDALRRKVRFALIMNNFFCSQFSLVQENAHDIYAHHLPDFDQYILSAMKKENMCPNEGLALQIALIGLSRDPPRTGDIIMNWDLGVFGSRFFSCTQEKELVEFFDNPLRSQEFCRTGATYAAAALAGFDEIFSESHPRWV